MNRVRLGTVIEYKCIRSTLVVEESEEENVTVRTIIIRGSCALIATHELKETKF